eukprot:PhF_6_TR11741/c0_g1_i1/m.19195
MDDTWARLRSTSFMERTFQNWESLVYIVLIPLGFLLGRYVFRFHYLRHVPEFSLQKELVENDNKAMAVAFSGFLFGTGLIIWGALAEQVDGDSARNIGNTIAWFFIGMVFLLIQIQICEYVLVPKLDNVKEIMQGNLAVAFVEAGMYVASGMVAMYAIGGGVVAWDEAISSAVLYFTITTLAFIAFYFIYDWISILDVQAEIAKRNGAMGVSMFGMLIGVAIYVTNPMKKSEELLAFAVWVALSGFIVWLAKLLVDKFMLGGIDVVQEIQSGRWGAAIVECGAFICMSIGMLSFLEGSCHYSEVSKGLNLNDRLTTVVHTKRLFRWHNFLFTFVVFFIIMGSKFLFAIPHFLVALRDGSAQRKSLTHSLRGMYLEAMANYLRMDSSKVESESVELGQPMRTESQAVFTDALTRAVSDSRSTIFCGFLICCGCVMRGSFSSSINDEDGPDLIIRYALYWLLIGYVMMFVGFYIARIFVWGFTGAPDGDNPAVAIVEAGIYIQVGINVMAGLTSNSEGGNFDLGPDTTMFVILFCCQESCVIIGSLVNQFITKYDDRKLVTEGNVAAALSNALNSIAFAMLAADPVTKSGEVANLYVFYIVAFVILIGIRIVVDKAVLVGRGVDTEIAEDKNWGAALCAGAVMVMAACCLTTFMREVCEPAPITTAILSNVTSAPTTIAPTTLAPKPTTLAPTLVPNATNTTLRW